MAVYDYRNQRTGEVKEEIFLPGEQAPYRAMGKDGDTWIRMPAAPRIVTADTRKFREWPTEKELLAKGKRPVERGHTKDVERARKYKEEKQDKALEEHVVASVNRAMP
jgi:hypothetical protein